MTLDRQTKERLVERYSSTFVTSPNAFILGYSGITVPQATELRRKVRAAGGRFEVVKNSLALIALGDSNLAELKQHFDGPTAVAYGGDDVVALAKALTNFSKDVPAIEFRAGLVDGSPVAVDDIKQIAKLPSREELIAQLVYMLQSPIARLVRGLGAITQQFVRVVEQIRQKKEAQSS